MKKIFFPLLCICIIVCSSPMAVRADRVVGNSNGELSDGVGNINDTVTSKTDINVAVVNTESRYAVDVTFPAMSIDFSSAVWNVNTGKYELDESTLPTENFEVQIANHSDKPVIVYGNFEKTSELDGIDIIYSAAEKRIPAVMAGATSAQTGSISISVTPKTGNTWADVFTGIASGNASDSGYSYTIGTLSVFVKAVPQS